MQPKERHDRFPHLVIFSHLVIFLLLALDAQADEPKMRHFLSEHCVRCHGAEEQNGDRRFDTLAFDLSSTDTLELWQDILDQLNLGEMPPSDERQPSALERQQIVDWMTAELLSAHAKRKSTGGRTVLRRLNRTQYNRTMRHLLSLEQLLADPTDVFPPDETAESFNNIGSALVTSDFLLNGYLAASESFVEHAVVTGPRPAVRKYSFTAPFCPTGNRHDGQDVDGQYQHIRKNTSDDGGFLWLSGLPEGVPQDGVYKLRFKAQAMYRNYDYDESMVGVSKSESLRVAVIAGSAEYGELESRTTSDRKLAEFDLPDDEPQWFETQIWLDAGYQPRLTFPNGPNRTKPLRRPLAVKYPDLFPNFIKAYVVPEGPVTAEAVNASLTRRVSREGPTKDPNNITTAGTSRLFNTRDGWASFFREYNGPRVRVFEIEMEGPLYETWPPKSHVALFGDYEPTMDNAEMILRRFASRAFRRPVSEDEPQALVDLVRRRHARGDSPLKSLKSGLRAVLCSPSFLYLHENDGPLDDYALASRLSYFLWSSMPDDELLDLAAQGELHRPEVLAAQTHRMLSDPKSEALTEQFTSRWLELYKIGSMPPSLTEFRQYYVDRLEEAMKIESQMFFQHLLEENLPIDQFLDSNFTFLNGGLARLYGIEGVTGSQFRKVSLDDDRRGGLLGHASVLTASANGIDTSPVVRGIWVLENILGTPPTPPPPDVEPLEPDIRGATTIREQLKKHRTVETCNQCHRKIDPLGFALENFDPIGGWRDHYRRGREVGAKVDASGQLPDGSEFKDIAGLKQILSSRRDQFAHCLTEKLLAYAMGRTLEFTDRPHVDRIAAELKSSGYGLRDLVLQVVNSEPFRTK